MAGPQGTTGGYGYGGFGSFFSGDVSELIRQPPEVYAAPPLPFSPPSIDPDLASRPFGHAFRKEFLINFEDWAFINHGAFGAVAEPVMEDAERWRRHCERQPLLHLDRELFPQMVRVIRDMTDFCGADPQDLVLLPNATTGLNVVVSSVLHSLGPGDKVYSLDIGYGSVKKMLSMACEDKGATHVTGSVTLPIRSPDDVISAVESSLPHGAALAVFDAVTSNSALALPLERLISICRERGVPVLIDGAHALMQLPFNINALGASYIVCNCHKWLCGARGSALLWVRRELQPSIRPLIVSHGSGCGFLSDFIWDGCRDYAPLLSLSTALTFWRTIGPARARPYMHALLMQAVALLQDSWGTQALAPPEMLAAMACVEVPAAAAAAAQRQRRRAERQYHHQQQQQQEQQQEQEQQRQVEWSAQNAQQAPQGQEDADALGGLSSSDASWLQSTLHFKYHIEVPIKFLAGRLWVRISAHVYNEIADYQKLADAVVEVASGTSDQPAL